MSQTFSTLPQLLPAAASSSSTEKSDNDRGMSGDPEDSEQCDNANGITVPVLNIEPRVERGIQVFTAIGSTFLIQSLNRVSTSSSVVVLLLLILLMGFCESIETTAKKLARQWGPKAFSSAIITFIKVLEFLTTLSIFVVVSYAIVWLSGLWIGGNLTFFEAAVVIVVGVAIAYTIAVAYHDVHNTLERAANARQTSQQQQQRQQQRKKSNASAV
jgi:hypothetical protein